MHGRKNIKFPRMESQISLAYSLHRLSYRSLIHFNRQLLRDLGLKVRWVEDICTAFQTLPETHTFSCTMSIRVLSFRSKGRGTALTTNRHLEPTLAFSRRMTYIYICLTAPLNLQMFHFIYLFNKYTY